MEAMAWDNAYDFIMREFGDVYGKQDEDDDDVFYCPECSEPIYRDDYPDVMYSEGHPICPICETVL